MWTYKREEIRSHEYLHPECSDIVYLITYSCGKMYIGKKTVRSNSIKPLGKTEDPKAPDVITRHILRDEEGLIITSKAGRKQARLDGLKAKAEFYKKVYTDKPFLKYEGSSKETEGLEVTKKEILYQCSNKKTATFLEAYELFSRSVLLDSRFVNSNILGSFFDNSLDGLIS